NGYTEPGGSFAGVEYASFSRTDMYNGTGLNGALGWHSSSTDLFTMIPAHIAAPYGSLPSSGIPEYIVSESTSFYAWEVRKFTAGTNCGSGGSLSSGTLIGQSSFSSSTGNLVTQPSPATSSNNLDSLINRLMQKVQYRKVGSAESLWVVHNVYNNSTVR